MTDIEAVNGKGNDWIWHAIFGGLTAVTLIGFMIWGHDYVCLLYTSPSPRD